MQMDNDWMYQIPVTYSGLEGVSWVSAHELDYIMSVVEKHDCYMEIGCASGVTATLIAQNTKVKRVLAVDTQEGCSSETFKKHTGPEMVEHQKKNFSQGRGKIKLITGNVQNAFEFLRSGYKPAAYPTVVFVDGDHREDVCFNDILVSAALGAKDILVHDYGDESWPGVRAAVAHFVLAYKTHRLFRVVQSVAHLVEV